MDASFATRLGTQAVHSLYESKATERVANPRAAFGADAQLLGVGVGVGGIDQRTVTDVSFDALVLDTGTDTTRLSWPASLEVALDNEPAPVTPTTDTIAFHLGDFPSDSGLSLTHIDRETLTVTPYTAVAPLRNVTGIAPSVWPLETAS
jgi:hypothetical protein